MGQQVRAAVRTGPRTTEMREFPMPKIGDDDALMKVEVAGICGTDVKLYNQPRITDPVIMGHENIGILVEAGPKFTRMHGVEVGDRIFVEHYVGCYHCEHCRRGDFRHCFATDWRENPDGRRFGYTSAEHYGNLWGGFSEYMYLPWNTVLHKVPDNVSAELAGIVTPMSNGVQWALLDAGVGFLSSVLIQGPGQQGLSQVVACKMAGASQIIVTGTSRDAARLELAKTLGADAVIDVQKEDALARVMELTDGKGVDVSLDCTAGAGTTPVLFGIDALKRKEGVIVIQGELDAFPDFPVKKMTEKAITIKSARGHSYQSCEMALQILASERFPLHLLATHSFGLEEADLAIRTVGGEGEEGVIHVSLLPWKGRED